MKKTKIIAALTAGVGVACAVPCSSVQKKNTVAMDRGEVRRTLASSLDAGVVGSNGEVILFYKSGGNIVIQQCGDYRQRLPRFGTPGRERREIHRALLQSMPFTFSSRLPPTGRVRRRIRTATR
jgi:hypothetical protein